MPVCLISLGSNVGNRRQNLDAAVDLLAQQSGVRLLACSRWRETAPIGGPKDQELFLNGALTLETTLPPLELLARLQQVEAALGRRRTERWGPRTLDLDLLLHGEAVVDSPALVLPHPRMAFRRCVLEPAAEVAGAMIHPTIRWSVARLLDHLNHSRPYLAIAGPIAAGKTLLAERLAREMPARLISERPDWRRLGDFYADPIRRGFAMELEFLAERTRLLASDNILWKEGATAGLSSSAREKNGKNTAGQASSGTPAVATQEQNWAVSDFWFEQSAAFARTWLSPEQFREFSERFEAARRTVAPPRLVVLLDAPIEELSSRVLQRGRECERSLTAESLERTRQAILEQTRAADIGPILRLSGDSEQIFTEAMAAARGME